MTIEQLRELTNDQYYADKSQEDCAVAFANWISSITFGKYDDGFMVYLDDENGPVKNFDLYQIWKNLKLINI